MTGVELLVGGWFASPVIKLVFDKAEKFLSGNYELQKKPKKMIKELTSTLLLCEATVQEVQKKKIINNPALTNWLRMLKETVYDAEDVLDNMEAKSVMDEVEGKNKVRRIASTSFSTAWRMIVPADDNLKSLKNVLVELNKLSAAIPIIADLVTMNENNESHLRKVNVPGETISQPFGKGKMFGRQYELNLILEIILGSESESSKDGHVIPIVGMGGVGKTALARAVYNQTEVEKTFQKRAWISVSNKPDVQSVMRKIYESLGYPSPDSISLEVIYTNITSCIGGVGKFLIVLDNLFEMIEDEWEVLYETFSHCAPGSVVLITTQNQEFAKSVGTFGPIALSTLDSGIFWELFEHFAFGNKKMSIEEKKTLESIGKKIAEKLGGLPLAAKIIGNTLRSKVDEGTWTNISKSEWWDIPEGKNRILQSIGLGYEQLDPCLRQCFAYCSVFPRNSIIEKDRLVHMWIAQNFILSNVSGETLEDIGRQWFDKLVNKSFFQDAGDNNGYVMHDLMHDLAVIVSSGECFYLGKGLVEIPSGVWHLAVDTNNPEIINGIQIHKNLRSFLYFNSGQVEGMYSAVNKALSKLDSIRVLDLSDMCMEKDREPPNNIWKLQHLRFLDLSSTGIKLLTSSSISLYHLQALYIHKCEFLELPSSIDKLMNRLQYLCADEKTIVQLMNRLQYLCADEKTIVQISDDIGQLTNFQKLSLTCSGKRGVQNSTKREICES